MSEPSPLPISIWQPRYRARKGKEEVVWERPPVAPLGDHFATRRVLTARPPAGVRRAILFGESAAAGYLYAPRLTPAGVLERELSRTTAWEVLDLARTNEGLASLLATTERALQLRSDLWVIYVGNNWMLREAPELSAYFPSARRRRELGAAFAEGGLQALIRLTRKRVLEKAGRTLAAVGEIAARAGVPLLLILPEVSLRDWEAPQPVGWLPGAGSRRWWRLRSETEALLGARQFRRALDLAWEMVDLDAETCPTSSRLLARAYAGLGELERARLAARAEIDAESYATLCGLGSPRVPSWGQELIDRLAAALSLHVVSLPELFASQAASASGSAHAGRDAAELPGRELFLDYCHLTRHGMEVAMKAVAQTILDLPGGWREGEAGAGEGRPPIVRGPEAAENAESGQRSGAAAADALAFLGAAIHTAHRLLPGPPKAELLRHWLRRALAADPEIESACWQLAAARSAPVAAVLTAAQRENQASPHPLLLQHGWRWDFLDADLLQALAEVLDERDAGAGLRFHGRLKASFGASAVGAELSRPPYLWEPLARFYPDVLPNRDLSGRAFHRSPWPISSFCFPGELPAEPALRMTLRLPAIPGAPGRREGKAELRWNGRVVGTIEVGERWRGYELPLPCTDRERRDQALHRIDLHWPDLPPWGEAARAEIQRRLAAGLDADLHPVFGDVSSLRLGSRPAA